MPTFSIVTLGMDLLSRENSCSSFCAAFAGWKPLGLPALVCVVGEDEEGGGREAVREEVREEAGDLVVARVIGSDV